MTNSAPQFNNLDGLDADGAAAFTLGGAAVHLDTDVTVLDAELGEIWTGARLKVQRYHDVNADDLFGLQFGKGSQIALDPETGALQYDFGSGLPTFALVTFGKGTLEVDFAGEAGAEAYHWLVNEVLQAITFATTDAGAAGSTVMVAYELEDMPGQAETLAGYGEVGVTVVRNGNTLDFSAAGDLAFDLDHDPETPAEHARSVAIALHDYEGTEDLRVSSVDYPFGDGPGYRASTITSLTGYDYIKITSAIGADGSDFFFLDATRALSLSGGYGSDTFTVAGSAGAVRIDGGAHRVDETGSQEFHDAVEYAGNAGIALDLAATDAEGFALVTRTRTDKSVVTDQMKDIEIVRATDGGDVIEGNEGFNAFAGFGGSDILKGRGGNDWFQGWTGDDTIDGGAGYDTANLWTAYGGADELGIKVDLNVKDEDGWVYATIYHKEGPETDKLFSIESIEGTAGDDEIIGDAGDNILAGYDGKNIIDAGAGNDLVYLLQKDTAGTQIRLGNGDDLVTTQVTYLTTNTDTLILVGSRADYHIWDASAETGTSGLMLIQQGYYSYAGQFLGIAGRKGTIAEEEGTDKINGIEQFHFLGADGVLGTADDEIYTDKTLLAPENMAPTATDATISFLEDAGRALSVADFGFSDLDAGDTFAAVRIDTLPAAGSLIEAVIETGYVAGWRQVVAGDVISRAAIDAGYLSFVLTQNGNGTPYATFTFSVQDSHGAFDLTPNTITVNVTPVNDAPVAVNDSKGTVDTHESILIDVLANDWDADGDPLTIVAGSVSAIGGTATVEDGKIRFTAGGVSGAALASYQVTDGQANSNVGQVLMSVVLVEGSPIANPDANQALAVVESGINNIANQVIIGDSVLDNDLDADDGDSLRVSGVATGVSAGAISGSVGRAVAGTYGVLRLGADGTWTYILDNTDADTQALRSGQSVDDVFTYTAMDTTGRTASSTLTVHVQGDDDAPLVATIPLQTGDEDEPLTIDVLAFAHDPEGQQVGLVGTPTASHGSVSISGGEFVYTPAPGYNGTDTIVFTVEDETGLPVTRTVPVAITPVNDAPVLAPQFAKGVEDTLVPLTLAASDPDAGDVIETFRIEDKPGHGTLYLDTAMKKEMSAGIDYATAKDGKLAVYFRPDDDYAGQSFFEFRAGDGELISDATKMTITVENVNDAPRAADKLTFAALEDVAYKGKLEAIDIDGDALTFTLFPKGTGALVAKNGKVSLATDGSFTYTPNKDFFGSDSFTYKVKDPSGETITRTAVVEIASVNDAPTFSLRSPIIGINEDTPGVQRYSIATNLRTGPVNESGQQMLLSVAGSSTPDLFQGTPVIDQSGNLSFILLPDAFGLTTLTIRLQDNGGDANGGGSFTDRELLINVRNVNDAPTGGIALSDTTPTIGDVLTATSMIADVDDMPGPLSYQWQRQSGRSWVNIAGATAASLAINETFVHQILRVQITYTDGGGSLERVSSAATAPVLRFGINGTPGADIMDGTEGDEVFVGSLGGDTIRGYSGSDTVNYIDSPQGYIQPLNFMPEFRLWLTTGVAVFLEDDSFRTGRGIGGFADGDVYTGIENVIGSMYDDLLRGNNAASRLEGLDGHDWLIGLGGRDTLIGGKGNDRLEGGDQEDDLSGGEGDDTLIGGWHTDVLNGGAGNDVVYAEYDIPPPIPLAAFSNTLFGGSGNDGLYGGGIEDFLYGEDGTDTLDGGAGDDRLEGGAGNDKLIGGLGLDVLFGGDGDDTLWGGAENWLGAPDLFLSNTLYGGDGNDRLYGDIGHDFLYGEAGNDRIDGHVGNDVIEGGDGNDTLIGGLGEDTLRGGAGSDTLWAAAEGLAGTPDLLFMRNTLEGGDGNDRLVGNAGMDTLIGGKGYDTMTGGLYTDLFVFRDADLSADGTSSDIILDFSWVENDKIDLGGIDASTLFAGHQSLIYMTDRNAAESTSGSLYVQDLSPFRHMVMLNLDGDRDFEMTIDVRSTVPTFGLGSERFVL